MKAARCTYPLSDGFAVSFDSATIKRVNFQWSNAAYNAASMSGLESLRSLFTFRLPFELCEPGFRFYDGIQLHVLSMGIEPLLHRRTQ